MMLIRSFPFLDPGSITPELTDRLRSLAEDGAALGSDPSFVSALLPRAPLLDRYAPVITSLGLRLAGEVTDHPLLGSRRIITSQLWWVDPNARWARSLSRFYRLGRPADTQDWDQLLSPLSMFDLGDDDGWPGNSH